MPADFGFLFVDDLPKNNNDCYCKWKNLLNSASERCEKDVKTGINTLSINISWIY